MSAEQTFHCDALTAECIVSGIKSCSKEEILSYLSSTDESDLKNLLFLSIKQSKHSFINQIINQNWSRTEEQDIEYANVIKTYFTENNNSSESTKKIQTSKFTEIPSVLCAYIVSFNTMKDRLKYLLTCKYFYKCCQIQMAKSHLIINHQFVKALYQNTVNYKKYTNIKYLDVNYVFSDPTVKTSTYFGFEHVYYDIISRIINKSPELHTINYRLTYKRFKYNLDEKCGDPLTGEIGSIFRWFIKVNKRLNYCRPYMFRKNGFDSVQKLVWTPSQSTTSWSVGAHTDYRHSFKSLLPNLQSLSMPKIKLYKQSGWIARIETHCGDTDCEWFLFKNNYFYDTLQIIDINMMPQFNATQLRNNSVIQHINIHNHPLYHFFKFKKLKSLTLRLPIFEESNNYYNQLWMRNNSEINTNYQNLYCLHLKKICIQFEMTSVNQFVGKTNNLDAESINYSKHINEICRYILWRCPNMIDFAINTNQILNDNLHNNFFFNYLIGHYGKLESLETDSLAIFAANTRLLTLKKLIFRTNKKIDNDKGIINFDFNLFPHLESFQCVYDNNSHRNKLDLNQNIISFLKYMLAQKCAKKLKYISLFHVAKKNEQKWYRFRDIEKTGLKICQLITSLTTSKNHCINIIELNPISIRQKESDFLSFWFNGQFGLMRTENLSNKTKSCVIVNYI